MGVRAIPLLMMGCSVSSARFTPSVAGDDSDPLCNVPIAVGQVAPTTPVTSREGGGYWLSAARTPSGLVVDWTAGGGLMALTLDLSTSPPTAGAPTMLYGSADAQSIQLIADASHITATMASSAGLQIVQTDLALAPLLARVEPTLTIGAPDHTAVGSDGELVIVGTTDTTEQVAVLDATDMIANATGFGTTTGQGGSLAAIPSGQFAAVWSNGSSCQLKVFAPSLTVIQSTSIAACVTARVAVSPDGERIAASFLRAPAASPFGVAHVALDARLSEQSAGTTLMHAVSSPRLASSRDAWWTIAPLSTTQLTAVATDFSGASVGSQTLAPFAAPATAFYTYDVVGDGERAWAVWLSELADPTLYIEQLCP
jgi:hypothetical protein